MKTRLASTTRIILPALLLNLAALPTLAEPAPDAKTTQLDEIVVEAQKDELAKKTPAVVESRTAEELKQINAVDSQDLLKQMPSSYVRKFYAGSTGSRLTVRANPSEMSARTLVLMDGARISNFIGTSHTDGPRWELAAPEEIERVDMIYGPFSAAHSGNSLGGTAIITTKMPTKQEISLETGYSFQQASVYNDDENLRGLNANLGYGDKQGDLAYAFWYKHLEADTQPITFTSIYDSAGGAATGNAGVGFTPEVDKDNRLRYVVGTGGYGTTANDSAKLKMAYDLDSYSQLKWSLAFSSIARESNDPASYLYGANGQPVISGPIDINGKGYNLSTNYKLSESEARDLLYALSYSRKPANGFRLDCDLSYYDILKDQSASSKALPHTTQPVSGTIADSDGGWYTADIKLGHDLKWLGQHAINLGYHYDHYGVENESWNAGYWKSESSRNQLTSADEGQTRTNALFAEDNWELNKQWALYLGARCDWWKGYGGSKSRDAAGSRVINELPDRRAQGFAPKLATTFKPADDLSIRYSLGLATRFPTIGELYFGGMNAATGILNVSNPNLRPESVIANDLTITKTFSWNAKTSLSFYQNDVDDSIYKQTNVYTSQTTYQNVDKVRTRGLELGLDVRDIMGSGLNLNASSAWANSKILRNQAYPLSKGNKFPKVPTRRAKLGLDYAPSERWFVGLSADYASRPYSTLDNSDRRGSGNTGYGGMDEYLIFNTRAGYKLSPQLSLTAGVDNLGDEIYFDSHPYQRRTVYCSLKYVFKQD